MYGTTKAGNETIYIPGLQMKYAFTTAKTPNGQHMAHNNV